MERFKIYGYQNLTGIRNENITTGEKQKEILITDSESISKFSTYNENFSIQENDKITFTFEIAEKVDGEINPFIELLNPESVIGLQLLDRVSNTVSKTDKEGSYYRLKIKERVPRFNKDTLLYEITCEDYASMVYSKQGEGLSLEMTGTLREIAEEILGTTRKNNLYKDLNKDIYRASLQGVEDKKKIGFKYALPYINYISTNMTPFKNTEGGRVAYNTAVVSDLYESSIKYNMYFDVVGLNAYSLEAKENLNAIFQVVGRRADGTQSFSSEAIKVEFKGNPLAVYIPFVFKSDTEYIDLHLLEDTSKPWPKSGREFSISLTNFKIAKNKDATVDRDPSETALFINRLENFTEQFGTIDGGRYSETKMTFSIQNSNLYNALVSLAGLFEAEVKFDYLDNAFYFESKKYRKYKGYRLHPDINLKSITRPESSRNFATILHLQGGEDVDGAVPPLPKEWRSYLGDCVANNFSSSKWFSTFDKTDTYNSLIPIVATYIDKDDSKEERMNEITLFAEQMDKVPNFESTLYNFSYFNEIGLLKDEEYNFLINRLNNDIRKLNISLNINSYKYYTIYSDFANQLVQLSFYVSAINTEQKFRYTTAQKLVGEDAPLKYSSSWVAYMNAIDSSLSSEDTYNREVNSLLGLGAGNTIDLKPGSFAYNAVMLFGYKNEKENGITKLINENIEKRNEKIEKRASLLEKLATLEKDIENAPTSFEKENISVEIAGVQRDLQDITTYMGIGADNAVLEHFYRGIYIIEGAFYSEVMRRLRFAANKFPSYITGKDISLFDLLFNKGHKGNIVDKKESQLETLMDKYEPFSLEARYENSEEVTAYGLLEQGLNTFVTINRPAVEYSISSINISAIEDYQYYTHPEVGDKIKVDGGLYLSYENESSQYLVITGYSETLRDPSSLSLTIEQDDEAELLVRRMLEASNFVKIGGGKQRSNYVIPVPQELKNELPLIGESLEQLNNSDLSVASIFNEMIKK